MKWQVGLIGLLTPALAWAGEALSVQIVAPETYRDFRVANQNPATSAEVFTKNLQRYWTHYVAEDWPEGYRLELAFTDIDLQGEVDPGTLERYGPGFVAFLELDYRLIAPDGSVVDAGHQKLRETRAANLRAQRITDDMVFRSEFALVHEWIERELEAKLPG